MVQLYFKHLYTSLQEWQDEPFSPWKFEGNVLLSILSFFESSILTDEFSLKNELQCETFMDSGAFAATSMGFQLDPYEVAELQAQLKADLIVPLDLIVFEHDSNEIAQIKIEKTIENTEILLDMKPKGSDIVAPLQGFTEEVLTYSYDKFKSLGINRFALGGLVFQSRIEDNLSRIQLAREVTKKNPLHIFGKFLHPELLHHLYECNVDSVDGYGYIVSSLKGSYVFEEAYKPIIEIEEDEFSLCQCSVCRENSLADFTKGNKEAQLLLIQHNIHALNQQNDKLTKQYKGASKQ